MNDIITLMTCAEEDGGIGNIHDTRQTVLTSDNGTYSNQLITHTFIHSRIMMMMMMMRRFVERVLNSPQTCCPSQSNRWDLRCRANAGGESVAIQRETSRLFQMCGPATAKVLILGVVVVLGTKNVPVSADRRRRLVATAKIA